jgi:hypothetical protein
VGGLEAELGVEDRHAMQELDVDASGQSQRRQDLGGLPQHEEGVHLSSWPERAVGRHGVPVVDGFAFARRKHGQRSQRRHDVVPTGLQTDEVLDTVPGRRARHVLDTGADRGVEVDALAVPRRIPRVDLDSRAAPAEGGPPRRPSPPRSV